MIIISCTGLLNILVSDMFSAEYVPLICNNRVTTQNLLFFRRNV